MPHVELRQDVLLAEVGAEGVLLDPVAGVYYSLNPIAALAWGMVRKGLATSEIITAIVSHFEVEPEVAARDLQSFLDDLARLRLAEIRE